MRRRSAPSQLHATALKRALESCDSNNEVCSNDNSKKLKEDIEKLEEYERTLECKITKLKNDGYSEEELDTTVKKMNRYNEIKDATQSLIGMLAQQKGFTVGEVHAKFGLDRSD